MSLSRKELIVLKNGFELETIVVRGGQRAIVFLHGFPDSCDRWHPQIDFFSQHGYTVVVPNLRGYGGSSRPEGIEQYQLSKLTSDVQHLIRTLGLDRPALIGHDFGGWIGWELSLQHPECFSKFVSLSFPEPEAFWVGLDKTRNQKIRSAYMRLFQTKTFAEVSLRAFHFKALEWVLKQGIPNLSASEIKADKLRWSTSLSTMLHWYRALTRPDAQNAAPSASHPRLLLYGANDPYLSESLFLESRAPDLERMRIPRGGHWPHRSEPDRVNLEILKFLDV